MSGGLISGGLMSGGLMSGGQMSVHRISYYHEHAAYSIVHYLVHCTWVATN